MTEELCGTSFSKSLVSSLAGSLDAELQAWRKRRLEAQAYPYLFVDARYEKVRADERVVNHRERGHLPGALPVLEAARAFGCGARHLK